MFDVKANIQNKGNTISGLKIGSTFLQGSKEEIIEILSAKLEYTNAPIRHYLIELKECIDNAISILDLNVEEPATARQSYEAYERFETLLTRFLGETSDIFPTSTMTIVQSQEGDLQTLIYNQQLKNAVSEKSRSTIYSGWSREDNDIKTDYARLKVSAILQQHYKNFYQAAINTGLVKHFKPGVKAGLIGETYFSHVMSQHQQILSRSLDEKNIDNLSCQLNNIKSELSDTIRHHDDWYRGGDIIIVNQNNEVVFSLQIKSTTTMSEKVGNLSRTNLTKRLQKLKSLLQTFEISIGKVGTKPLAHQIYNMLVTQAIKIDNANDLIANSIFKPQIN